MSPACDIEREKVETDLEVRNEHLGDPLPGGEAVDKNADKRAEGGVRQLVELWRRDMRLNAGTGRRTRKA